MANPKVYPAPHEDESIFSTLIEKYFGMYQLASLTTISRFVEDV
jgi:hypothetical protein